MVRDLQIDPTTHEVKHLDFQRMLMDQLVRVRVQVELVGESRAASRPRAVSSTS